MRMKWISVLIMLTAGAISCMIFLIQRLETNNILLNLAIILPIFYIFGKIIEKKAVKINNEVLEKERTESDRIKQIVVDTLIDEENMDEQKNI